LSLQVTREKHLRKQNKNKTTTATAEKDTDKGTYRNRDKRTLDGQHFGKTRNI